MPKFIRNFIFATATLLPVFANSQNSEDTLLFAACSEGTFNRFLPKATHNYQVIQHSGFSLGYSEYNEQATWVSYVLLPEECGGDEERSSSFYPDPKVSTGSATNEDYKGSGYDRGHLAPAGDMGYSAKTMRESFYYSNMSPQNPSFNRGIWKKLEGQVRDWAKNGDTLLIITGPVLSDSLKLDSIGPNGVRIPKAYYKVIVKRTSQGFSGIGFVLPNEASSEALNTFVVTIDAVEKMTGLDFLPQLSKNQQKRVESSVKQTIWPGIAAVKSE
ncbi:MAG: DNA/RNA non-specific endonuclease [Fluviicola sp.]|jgi:endonuclease G